MGVQQDERHRPLSHDERDEDHHRQQGADADDDHHLNLKEKKPRQLPVPWMTDEFAAMASVLPRVLTEYNTEDAARFEEDMARTDKMLDELEARVAPLEPPVTSRGPVGPYMTPGLLYEKEDEEEVVVGNRRVSKADIKMLRSFVARSGYHPVSERFLCDRSLITQAGAEVFRKSDRLMSKVYALTQEGIREVLRHYDATAKGGSAPDGTGTSSINPSSTRPADH